MTSRVLTSFSDLDFIEANILTKFHQDWVKTVTSSVNKLIVDDERRTEGDDNGSP